MSGMPWTAEMEEHLRELLRDHSNPSYVEIAGIMAQRWDMAFSNNSIAGKVSRMGLAHARPQHNHPPHKKLRPRELPPAPPPSPEPVHPTLFQLRPTSCRWPIGWDDSGNYLFCGALKADVLAPYCDVHAQQAFVKARLRQPVVMASIR